MKKKNNGILVGILIGLVIALIIVVGLIATSTISFKKNTSSDIQIPIKSFKIEDYVTKEKVNIGDDTISVEKVILKNLDSSLTQEYIEKQNELIKSAESTYNYFKNNVYYNKNESLTGLYIEGTNLLAESNIWYQINKDILTIYYELKESGEIGISTLIAVTNIDLKNKKVLTNEEILKLGGSSFKNIATKEYERVLDVCVNRTDQKFCYWDKNDKEVTTEEHKNNRETFINNIEVNLDNQIKAYIQDGKIKYDYQPYRIRTNNEMLHLGGPFPYETMEVGEYK